MIKLYNEDLLLDQQFRAKLIHEITGQENIERKNRELRKYEVYRDRTSKWVIEALTKEFAPETVMLMQNRASNISICRKAVNKLAQAYQAGVIREMPTPEQTQVLHQYVELLNANQNLKKIDRYERLHKNTTLGIIPIKDTYESELTGSDKFRLVMRPLSPFAYDVVPDPHDETKAKCVILTDFIERNAPLANPRAENPGIRSSILSPGFSRGDTMEQSIADEPDDRGKQKRTFIFWSNKYHFTTDQNGYYIEDLSPEDKINPIQILPWINFAKDQDTHFWAEGGDDLIDGSVLINVLLTDLFTIANNQGWGQLVATGKNLPDRFKLGPQRAVILEYDTGDPTPTLDYVNASPDLQGLMNMIEMYTALLLSTNNLSPRNISGKLDVSNVASGIAKLVDESESTEDITEAQQEFKDKEPVIWEIFKRWRDLYGDRNLLTSDFANIDPLLTTDIKITFLDPKPVVAEEQKLANLKVRKELGINTMLDLVKLDNPQLTQEEAEEKLKQILEEKLNNVANAIGNAMQNATKENNNDNANDDENPITNNTEDTKDEDEIKE